VRARQAQHSVSQAAQMAMETRYRAVAYKRSKAAHRFRWLLHIRGKRAGWKKSYELHLSSGTHYSHCMNTLITLYLSQ